jgi:3-deoxy-D-manno-octulosonic-acid transferase
MAGLLTVYEYAIRAGKPFLEYLLSARARKGKEEEARLDERRGAASRPRPSGRLVWIHAASVGEAQSALILIDALGKRETGVHVVVTSGTVTSAQLMARRLPPFAFHQYAPLDHPEWTGRFLDYWKPDLALWMESELWPNILRGMKKRNIPAILINARLSEKSFGHWMRGKGMARAVLQCFSLILTQTENDAARFKTLGAENVIASDNIKYSAAPLPCDPVSLSGLKLTLGERPRWVYASTHAGEENLACRMHKRLRQTIPDLLTIIVPRHPQRREDVAGICYEEGMKFKLRSNNMALPTPDDDIYIADTLGELGLFYSLSPIAMIGRSFSNDGGGGHNPIEAAQLGCAVITGPNNQFQRQIYDDMQAQSAVVEAQDEEELFAVLREMLTEPHTLLSLQRRCTSFAQAKAHVVDDVMEKISPFLTDMENRHAA